MRVLCVCAMWYACKCGGKRRKKCKLKFTTDGQGLSCGEQSSTLRHKLGVITMCGFSVVLYTNVPTGRQLSSRQPEDTKTTTTQKTARD